MKSPYWISMYICIVYCIEVNLQILQTTYRLQRPGSQLSHVNHDKNHACSNSSSNLQPGKTFDFNVAYSSRWGYSLINTLKLKKMKNRAGCTVDRWFPRLLSSKARLESYGQGSAKRVLCTSVLATVRGSGESHTIVMNALGKLARSLSPNRYALGVLCCIYRQCVHAVHSPVVCDACVYAATL